MGPPARLRGLRAFRPAAIDVPQRPVARPNLIVATLSSREDPAGQGSSFHTPEARGPRPPGLPAAGPVRAASIPDDSFRTRFTIRHRFGSLMRLTRCMDRHDHDARRP